MNITAEKMLAGRVYSIHENYNGVEIVIEIPGGKKVTAVLTKGAFQKLDIAVGKPLFKNTKLVDC
ncbi:MAG: TOBE domain-containing protein [Fibrobacter sp.]|nr:TOBE domain-containing protein [Fibrobacter sp.]